MEYETVNVRYESRDAYYLNLPKLSSKGESIKLPMMELCVGTSEQLADET